MNLERKAIIFSQTIDFADKVTDASLEKLCKFS